MSHGSLLIFLHFSASTPNLCPKNFVAELKQIFFSTHVSPKPIIEIMGEADWAARPDLRRVRDAGQRTHALAGSLVLSVRSDVPVIFYAINEAGTDTTKLYSLLSLFFSSRILLLKFRPVFGNGEKKTTTSR